MQNIKIKISKRVMSNAEDILCNQFNVIKISERESKCDDAQSITYQELIALLGLIAIEDASAVDRPGATPDGLSRLNETHFFHAPVSNEHVFRESAPPRFAVGRVVGESVEFVKRLFKKYDVFSKTTLDDERRYLEENNIDSAKSFIMEVLKAYAAWFKSLEPTAYHKFMEHDTNMSINSSISASLHLFEKYGYAFDPSRPNTYVRSEEPLISKLSSNPKTEEFSKNLSLTKTYNTTVNVFCDGTVYLRRFAKKPLYLRCRYTGAWYKCDALKLSDECVIVQLEYKTAKFSQFKGLHLTTNPSSYFDENTYANGFDYELVKRWLDAKNKTKDNSKAAKYKSDRIFPYDIVPRWNKLCDYGGPIPYSSLVAHERKDKDLNLSKTERNTLDVIARSRFVLYDDKLDTVHTLMRTAETQLINYRRYKKEEIERFLKRVTPEHMCPTAYRDMLRDGLSQNKAIDRFDFLSVAAIALNNDIVYAVTM